LMASRKFGKHETLPLSKIKNLDNFHKLVYHISKAGTRLEKYSKKPSDIRGLIYV